MKFNSNSETVSMAACLSTERRLGDFMQRFTPIEKRPDPFRYSNYKTFIEDMLFHYRTVEPGFSIRNFSKRAGISSGYISIILNTPKHMTHKTLTKIIPYFHLSPTEASYFRLLRDLATPKSAQLQAELIARIERFRQLRDEKTSETEMIGYLEKWYHIVIRELANDPDFKLDPVWIQKRLHFHINETEIENSLHFLLECGFIQRKGHNKAQTVAKRISFTSPFFSTVLIHSHRQFLDLAAEALTTIAKEDQTILGHSMFLDPEGYKQARQILGRALEEIAEIQVQDFKNGRVYNFDLVAHPLTKTKDQK